MASALPLLRDQHSLIAEALLNSTSKVKSSSRPSSMANDSTHLAMMPAKLALTVQNRDTTMKPRRGPRPVPGYKNVMPTWNNCSTCGIYFLSARNTITWSSDSIAVS